MSNSNDDDDDDKDFFEVWRGGRGGRKANGSVHPKKVVLGAIADFHIVIYCYLSTVRPNRH